MTPSPISQLPTPNSAPPAAPALTDPDDLLRWIVCGFVRHLATILGGALVTHGLATQASAQPLLGALIALGMMGWSALEKLIKADGHRLALLAAGAQDKLIAQLAAKNAVGEAAGFPSTNGKATPSPTVPPNKPPGTGAGVGPIPLIAALAILLSGCAQTTLYDRHTGSPIARFQGDMTVSHYADGATTWDVQSVSHSAATTAQGAAAANVIGAAGSAAAGAVLAAGSSGLFPAAAAVAAPAISSFINRPAALQAK